MEGDSDYRGVLVLSVWAEGGDGGPFRARILSEPRSNQVTYHGSIDDVVAQVRRWLVTLDQTEA